MENLRTFSNVADVTPLHKTGSKCQKGNYRPVSILPTISKVFERILCDQIYDFMNDKLSPILSGFRKGYSVQHVLTHMLHNWHKCLDQGGNGCSDFDGP